MQTNNPVLSRRDAFDRLPTPTPDQLNQMYATPARMTVDDVVVRTAILLGTLVVTGGLAWALDASTGLAVGAGLVGFVLALVVIFTRTSNPALMVAYAAVEGVFLGAVSHAFESYRSGIVIQAVIGTVACFGGVLVAYRSGRIRVTPRFTRMLMAAFIGVLGLMVANLLVSLFGGSLGIRSGGGIAIVFSLVCIVVASLSFALDFDAIEAAARAGVPAEQSWRAAFGLVVGLVWLYTEILRLLGYLRR